MANRDGVAGKQKIPSLWYLGSAPFSMVWIFLNVGGLSWFPTVSWDVLVAVPFAIWGARVASHLAIAAFSKLIAPLYSHEALLFVCTVASSLGVWGACAAGFGLIGDAWLLPSLAFGSFMSVPLQLAWVEFFSTLERQTAVSVDSLSSLLAFVLALCLFGLVARVSLALLTVVLAASGLLSLAMSMRCWVIYRMEPVATVKAEPESDDWHLGQNTAVMTVVELAFGLAYGLILCVTIAPPTPVWQLLLALAALALPTVFLIRIFDTGRKSVLFKAGWPVAFLFTLSYAVLGVSGGQSLAVACMAAAYLYFGLFFNAFGMSVSHGKSQLQRFRTINGGSLIGAAGVAVGCLAGIFTDASGGFHYPQVSVLVVIMVVIVNVGWAVLLNSDRHSDELGLSPEVVPVPASVLGEASCSDLASRGGLTPAEEDILRALAANKSPKAIAKDRSVSVATVRSQIKSVYAKLSVHSREELMDLLYR